MKTLRSISNSKSKSFANPKKGSDPFFGRIGVLCGGTSKERAISLRSGRAVYEALKESGLDVRLIDIHDGILHELVPLDIHIAFIALHGEWGEDGEVQAILERLQIPYVGSGPEASGRAFDKARAKEIFHRSGIPTPAFQVVEQGTWRSRVGEMKRPFFVKPACEGSSINVFFIEEEEEAWEVIPRLFRDYPKLLLEEKIFGKELTVGILDEKPLPVIELRPKNKFYDYEAKYTTGFTEYVVPAELSDERTSEVQALALKAHRVLGLRDFSRIDLILGKDKPYILEANTIPGLTEMSLLPKAAQAAGIDFTHLCLKLLELARERVHPVPEKASPVKAGRKGTGVPKGNNLGAVASKPCSRVHVSP